MPGLPHRKANRRIEIIPPSRMAMPSGIIYIERPCGKLGFVGLLDKRWHCPLPCHCEPVRHSSALRAAAKRRLRSARACGRSGVAIPFGFRPYSADLRGIATPACGLVRDDSVLMTPRQTAICRDNAILPVGTGLPDGPVKIRPRRTYFHTFPQGPSRTPVPTDQQIPIYTESPGWRRSPARGMRII